MNSSQTPEKPKRNCAGLANYTATVRIPDGGPNGKFTLAVLHDGEVVRRGERHEPVGETKRRTIPTELRA
ncbi:hypothetical protein [Haladaptatus pallidirubidus]|uniref:Uncharacterized protein n=1 Tax=Haladaptatus pallidirubidus TaxID=1008152 RepID=A0AAV3UDY8_9EURY|nr:hypothetical protein [Haladaptatus pallidirubidus]